MKHFLPITLAALIAFALPAQADEHLVPEENQFTRAGLPNGQGSLAPYYEMVISLLREAYTPEVRARVIVMPSYGPEYAVGVRAKDGAYALFHLGLDTQVWRYEMLQAARRIDRGSLDESVARGLDDAIAELETSLPKNFQTIGVERCEMAVTPALAEGILSVWQSMLLQTRYTPSRQVGRDGTDYHFSMPGETQYLSGKAWEPPPDSDAGRLVRIAETMKESCLSRDAARLQDLQPQVDDMRARLGG